jgi:hypothetical protein
MSIRCDVGHAVALFHTERLQHRRPGITSSEEFLVIQPESAIHYGLAFAVKLSTSARELERGQRGLHSTETLSISGKATIAPASTLVEKLRGCR